MILGRLLAALAGVPPRASAPGVLPFVPLHGIGSRRDLPLPFSYVLAGAALTLIVSFAVVAWAWRQPRYSQCGGRPLPRLTRLVDDRRVRLVAAALVLALWAWICLAFIAGPDEPGNLVFGFVFIWVWVGLVPLSLLTGTTYRALNPMRTLTSWRPSRPLPAWLGVWPAAVMLLGFAWFELVCPARATLAGMSGWWTGWLAVVLLPALGLGGRWVGAADPFEVYASTVAALSPFARVDGSLRLVSPLRHACRWAPPAGTTAVVCVLLGATMFDSLSATTGWVRFVQASPVVRPVWGTAGLVTVIALVAASYTAACALMRRHVHQPLSRRAVTGQLAPSIVPVVVGYALGHYLSLLVVEGQRTLIRLSDPLQRGWNIVGTARLTVNPTVFAYPAFTALVQLGCIVGGHVLGIMVAHERALRLLHAHRRLSGQLPLLVVMVAYTCTGLVLLFSP